MTPKKGVTDHINISILVLNVNRPGVAGAVLQTPLLRELSSYHHISKKIV